MKISIIGAGNSGQAFPGFLSIQGYEASVYDRNVTCSQKTGHSKLEFSGIFNNFKNVIIAYETLKIYGISDFICPSAS